MQFLQSLQGQPAGIRFLVYFLKLLRAIISLNWGQFLIFLDLIMRNFRYRDEPRMDQPN